MTHSISSLIERQMLKAQAEGQLDNISGAGKPLPRKYVTETGMASVSSTIKAGMGVPRRQGPLKEQLAEARKSLQDTTDPEKKKALVAEIAKLELAYNIEREAYLNFMK
ncbi:DnaJ family domain-containing protein [Shimia haliotis]|uniref:DnaJ homologue subfamily C member 28 conserved domain-containing protein n=1 Tax=Shimia haliotis TaxID=1280847 RepID=A0A1I4F7N0_9RHOB|nr:DnaJ family domain-containing protein [Shimia haliotis]SFL12421.1 protein of unknown function [Shimia haliotis]